MNGIYLDSLFFLNLLADYLLCLASGRICGLVLRRGRYLLAALLGATYAVAGVLPGFGWLSSPVWKIAAGLAMGLLAFGAEDNPLRCTGVLFAVSAALGGALWAIALAEGADLRAGPAPLSLRALALSFALCYAALRLFLRRRLPLLEKPRARVQVRLWDREAVFMVLRDTGNTLSDPLTGAAVLVATPHALSPILREHTALFEQLPAVELLEASGQLPELAGRLRLLPCSGISGTALMPVLRPERVSVDGRDSPGLLLAVSPAARGDGFEGIL